MSSSRPPQIRSAVPADAGEVLTLQRAAWVSEARLHETTELPPLTQTLAELRAELATSTALVALDGARIVGTVRAVAAGDTWHIGRLGVAPDRQGEGIGAVLLRAIEERAPAEVVAFELFTGPRSTANVAFYERAGYRRVPSTDDLIHLRKASPAAQVHPRRARSEELPMFERIDHVGIAVPDLDEAIAFYRDTFGIVSVHEETNEEQGVREAMLAVGDGSTRIQLLAPLTPESTIAKFIGRSGPGVQQVAYTVADIEAVSATLRERGMRLLYDAPRRGTADSKVNFVHPKDARGVLMELVEPAPDAH